MNKNQSSMYHEFVWNTLTTLDDGERILGESLMVRAGIKDRRFLYQVIRDLRKNGLLIGSSKHREDRGYFEIRDEYNFHRWASSTRKSIEGQQQIEKIMYEMWEKRQRKLDSEDEKSA